MSKEWLRRNPEKAASSHKKHRASHPKFSLVQAARKRSRESDIPCTIQETDFEIPDVCPVLGLPLVKGVGVMSELSPSLDKVIPALGYVPGNVRVISMRANRIKSDATVEELERILAYVRNH